MATIVWLVRHIRHLTTLAFLPFSLLLCILDHFGRLLLVVLGLLLVISQRLDRLILMWGPGLNVIIWLRIHDRGGQLDHIHFWGIVHNLNGLLAHHYRRRVGSGLLVIFCAPLVTRYVV